MGGYNAFAYFYDKLTENISYKDRAAYFDRLIKLHGGKKGILLDLACGTGSLSEEWHGWDMTSSARTHRKRCSPALWTRNSTVVCPYSTFVKI